MQKINIVCVYKLLKQVGCLFKVESAKTFKRWLIFGFLKVILKSPVFLQQETCFGVCYSKFAIIATAGVSISKGCFVIAVLLENCNTETNFTPKFVFVFPYRFKMEGKERTHLAKFHLLENCQHFLYLEAELNALVNVIAWGII